MKYMLNVFLYVYFRIFVIICFSLLNLRVILRIIFGLVIFWVWMVYKFKRNVLFINLKEVKWWFLIIIVLSYMSVWYLWNKVYRCRGFKFLVKYWEFRLWGINWIIFRCDGLWDIVVVLMYFILNIDFSCV